MGLLIGFLAKPAINWIASQFKRKPSSNINWLWNEIHVGLDRVMKTTGSYVLPLVFAGQQIKGAHRDSQGRGAGIGADVNDIAGAMRGNFERLYNTILPSSIAWLDGHLMANEINPIKGRLHNDEKAIGGLENWADRMKAWRDDTVDPEIKDTRGFKTDFNKNLRPTVDQWVSWFRAPGDFGEWAAAPLIGPLVAYLKDPSHTGTRDGLTSVIIGVSPRLAKQCEAAVVAILNTGW
jgi:hypothetical protein